MRMRADECNCLSQQLWSQRR